MADKDLNIGIKTTGDTTGAKAVEDSVEDVNAKLKEMAEWATKAEHATTAMDKTATAAESAARSIKMLAFAQLAGQAAEFGKRLQDTAEGLREINPAAADAAAGFGELMSEGGKAASTIATGFATGGPVGAAVGAAVAAINYAVTKATEANKILLDSARDNEAARERIGRAGAQVQKEILADYEKEVKKTIANVSQAQQESLDATKRWVKNESDVLKERNDADAAANKAKLAQIDAAGDAGADPGMVAAQKAAVLVDEIIRKMNAETEQALIASVQTRQNAAATNAQMEKAREEVAQASAAYTDLKKSSKNVQLINEKGIELELLEKAAAQAKKKAELANQLLAESQDTEVRLWKARRDKANAEIAKVNAEYGTAEKSIGGAVSGVATGAVEAGGGIAAAGKTLGGSLGKVATSISAVTAAVESSPLAGEAAKLVDAQRGANDKVIGLFRAHQQALDQLGRTMDTMKQQIQGILARI